MIDKTTQLPSEASLRTNEAKKSLGKLNSFISKLKQTASNWRIIPAHEYNPTKKPMSRRDRIRAGFQKRNQRNSVVLDDLNY